MDGALSAMRTRLESLPPRALHVIARRLLRGTPRSTCARFFGVSPDAFDVMLLNAVRALSVGDERARPFEQESKEADALRRCVEAQAAPPGEAPWKADVSFLLEHGPALHAALIEAERVRASTPARRREEWLRRLAIVAILAMAAYFYWKRPMR